MKEIKLYYGYINKYTIDTNKHPDEQLEDFYNLLRNSNEDTIIIYSNSPYIINEITIVNGYFYNNIPHPEGFLITNKHFEILQDGTIKEGKYYKGMISDDNLLNNKLAEGNAKYDEILEKVQEREYNERNKTNICEF